jgi:cytoskeletal protein CcmA (bactofilin family)
MSVPFSRMFFDHESIEGAAMHVAEKMAFKDGVIEANDGLLVDGKLTNVTIKSVDGSPIYISALARLVDCNIEAADLLVEGSFSGNIIATGKAEFGSGCVVIGKLRRGAEVYVHRLADLDDLKVTSERSAAKDSTSSSVHDISSYQAQAAA